MTHYIPRSTPSPRSVSVRGEWPMVQVVDDPNPELTPEVSASPGLFPAVDLAPTHRLPDVFDFPSLYPSRAPVSGYLEAAPTPAAPGLQPFPVVGPGPVSVSSDEPAACNTPVINTTGPENALIDGFSVTFLGDDADLFERVCLLFGGAFVQQPRGMRCYAVQHLRGEIRILSGGIQSNMGVNVSTQGEGCRQLEREGLVAGGWPAFVGQLIRAGGRFARLDPAIDDKEGKLDLTTIELAYDNQEFICNSGLRKLTKSIENGVEGVTFNFGSRSSERYMRIYDKAAKLCHDKETLPRVVDDVVVWDHWLRVEIELKGETASKAAVRFAEEGFPVLVGLIRSFLEFKLSDFDTNKSRWDCAGWWVSFLEDAEKTRLGFQQHVKTLQKSWRWIVKNVLPVFAVLNIAAGWDETLDRTWFGSYLAEAAAKLTPAHRALLAACSSVGSWRPHRADWDGVLCPIPSSLFALSPFDILLPNERP